MKFPKPDQERKILQQVIEQLSDPEGSLRRLSRMRRIVSGLGNAGMLAGFVLALGSGVHPFWSALLAAAGGCGVGLGVFLEWSLKQWPVTRRHIDLESVQRRMAELRT